VGPRAGLDGRKFSSPPGLDPGPSSPKSFAIPTELPSPHHQEVLLCIYSNPYMSCVYVDWVLVGSDPTNSQST